MASGLFLLGSMLYQDIVNPSGCQSSWLYRQLEKGLLALQVALAGDYTYSFSWEEYFLLTNTIKKHCSCSCY